ncbi:InlB B-repeat-containing protein, partial [Sporosarcina sp. YIM B06819]|uniref:InlB B-repeat-containing protein n=1 Tax=Sporosarcina sp. YIM B06819 TaxID=3081769 RepID=UPI00298C2617
TTEKVTSATTLYAKWTINNYTVTFDSQGGSTVSDQTANYNTMVAVPTAPTKVGYTFDGWFKEVGLTNAWNFTSDMVTTDTTLYAKWTTQKYTVNFNVDEGSAIATQEIEHGQFANQPVSAPTKTGYTFAGWYTDDNFGTAFVFANNVITAPTIIYAKWEINNYVVTFDTQGGDALSSASANHNTVIAAPTAPTKEGYTFVGWYKDSAATDAWDFTTDKVTSATTLYAKWTINNYTVTFNSQGGSAVSDKTTNYNTAITAPTPPTKAGYRFVGWYKESAVTNAWNFTGAITEDITLYAKWVVYNEPTPPTPSTPSIPSKVEEINVDVETGTTIIKTPVVRTTDANGTIKDQVTFTSKKADETIGKLKDQNQNTAKIIIPDTEDKVKEVNVTVPKAAVSQLANGQVNLEIFTENVLIHVPQSSMQDFDEDLYFRVIPLKDQAEKNVVEQRAKQEEIVQKVSKGKTIQVLGRPMTIETNMENRPVTLTLPLLDSLPKDESKRQEMLNNLAVYIEHDDGTLEVIKGKLVVYKNGEQGIEFDINKFSTFTLLYMEGLDDYLKEQDTHSAYIQGYLDKTFRPEAPVTRAHMAAMLARNSGYSEQTGITNGYKDVPKTHWAYNDILAVKNTGFMVGDGKSFNPNNSITRAQMATIVYRWVKNACENDPDAYKQCASLSNINAVSYTDVSSKHSAAQAILAIQKFKIMEGYADGTFRLEEKLTRAQAVKVLNRLFKRGPLNGDFKSSFKDVKTSHWAFREIEEASRNHAFTISTDGKEILLEK